jgi:hypothetical protein
MAATAMPPVQEPAQGDGLDEARAYVAEHGWPADLEDDAVPDELYLDLLELRGKCFPASSSPSSETRRRLWPPSRSTPTSCGSPRLPRSTWRR